MSVLFRNFQICIGNMLKDQCGLTLFSKKRKYLSMSYNKKTKVSIYCDDFVIYHETVRFETKLCRTKFSNNLFSKERKKRKSY